MESPFTVFLRLGEGKAMACFFGGGGGWGGGRRGDILHSSVGFVSKNFNVISRFSCANYRFSKTKKGFDLKQGEKKHILVLGTNYSRQNSSPGT